MLGKYFYNKKVLILSDYDNTIGFFKFTPEVWKYFRQPEWNMIAKDFLTGKIGSKEAYKRALRIFHIGKKELLSIIDNNMELDKYFPDFWKSIKKRGWKFIIVSDGFKIYIERVLSKYGVIPDSIYANEVVFDEEEELKDVIFPYQNEDRCKLFATCKIGVLESLSKEFDKIFYFGDGVTDFGVADKVYFLFAKDKLAHYAAENKIPFFNYRNFGFIRDILKKPVGWVIFDLDGVLIDSEEAILYAVNTVRNREGLSSLSIEHIRRYIGLPLKEFLEKLVGNFQADFVPLFREAFRKVFLDVSKLLPGAKSTIESLSTRGYNLGIITNKKGEYARQLIDHLKLSQFFSFVIGEEENLPQKPEGELWDYLASQKGVELDASIYVGDAEVDLEFAKSRGLLFAGVGTGSVSAVDFLKRGADLILNSVSDLERIL